MPDLIHFRTRPNCAACGNYDCHWRCALEVIDELLRLPAGVSGEEADGLLDLRWKLRQRDDAAGALRIFCELRLSLEHRHYLAFFRIRRWLENHVLAAVRICPTAAEQPVRMRLDHDCVEAIRRVCLCAALGTGAILLALRLTFRFRPLSALPDTARMSEFIFAGP